jgi:hypothetical protein
MEVPHMARAAVGVLGLALSLLLPGCIGAYQVTADRPTGSGALMPTVADKDAGLVGISSGFDLKAYPVIAVGLFPVSDSSIKDAGDRRLASSMSAFFQSELVRRLRESGLFARVVNLTETPWQPGTEKALGWRAGSRGSARAPRPPARSSASTERARRGLRAT